mmetsp:Transcript_33393/g.94404  ORF Transcript_33393/g.94404 Transcript_33393/m.94404 type:complete len:113 (+) Transcript_33393:2077-2415(+)
MLLPAPLALGPPTPAPMPALEVDDEEGAIAECPEGGAPTAAEGLSGACRHMLGVPGAETSPTEAPISSSTAVAAEGNVPAAPAAADAATSMCGAECGGSNIPGLGGHVVEPA